jgi:hypothetical protein
MLKKITRLAKEAGETRVLRLLQVITNDDNKTNPKADVWYIFEPTLPITLSKVASLGLLASRPDV